LPGGVDLQRGRVQDFFDAWVFAAADAERALVGWELAAVRDRTNAYLAYRAALDREERAAQMLSVVALQGRARA
jgi:hypothetical protein